MKKYLQRLSLMLVALFVLGGAAFAPRAYADSTDEANMGLAARAVNDLWDFIDSSGDLEDTEFFTQFDQQAALAKQNLDMAYDGLMATEEKDPESLQAIYSLQSDIRTMGEQVDTWRFTASEHDLEGFEEVNAQLSSTVDSYDKHIELYNAAKNGGRTVTRIALHAAVAAVAFALMTLTFAIALLKDDKSERDASKEIMRRLRWRLAYAGLAIFVGSCIPALLYFWAGWENVTYYWLLIAPGLAAFLFVLYQCIRTVILIRRRA
ncbi:MAG TPA: hypothetical protein VLA92_02965 [Candidatus Saccharimonadales bacterium]|nr:hypothetical protein [Candidatus Saccharimonadales bacterium]